MAKAAEVETQDMFDDMGLATTEDSAVMAPEDYAELFDIKENMEGIDVRLPQVGIVHQAQMFKMPDEEKADKFTGIILDTNNVNAWWKISFDESGGGSPPQCFSNNGIQPSGLSEDPQAQWCAKCNQNKFGSAGRGKACKNMKRIHIRMPDAYLPYRLTLPPSNLRPISEYVTTLSSKGLPYQAVTTEFSLVKAQNKEGIEYSLLKCRMKKRLDKPAMVALKKERDEMLSVMRDQEVGAEEFNQS